MLISVLIIDDHAFIRRGVLETLEREPDIEVVGEAETGEDGLEMARELGERVSVVVTDLTMPGLGGIELISRLEAERPGLPVLVLSTHSSREVGVQVLAAGGAGYLEKGEAPERLPTAVRRVAAGRKVVGPDLAELLSDHVLGDSTATQLSVREHQVVTSIARGHTREETAGALSLNASTVSTYRSRALEKLGLATDADLTRHAVRLGWVDAPPVRSPWGV